MCSDSKVKDTNDLTVLCWLCQGSVTQGDTRGLRRCNVKGNYTQSASVMGHVAAEDALIRTEPSDHVTGCAGRPARYVGHTSPAYFFLSWEVTLLCAECRSYSSYLLR